MPQKLSVEITSADGSKSIRQVHVIRSWQDNTGSMIMLFANGSYGYKNGEPVQTEREFDIITSPVQRKAAKAWWQRAGADLAAGYYAAKERREAELIGDFQPDTAAESEFDMVLYTREPSDGSAPPSGPFSWPELFSKRPDWWGQARSIKFNDYIYEQADSAAAAPPAMDKPPEEKLEAVEESSGFRVQGSGKSKKQKSAVVE